MTFDIDRTVKAIERLYQFPEELPVAQVPRPIQASLWFGLAEQFLAAATILERDGLQHWRVIVQNTGHALELAFKACILARDSEAPRGHDLIALYRAVDELGFKLEEAQFAAIAHLHHHYYIDLDTGTKFKARYPTAKSERLGGAVPETRKLAAVVASLADQASRQGSK